MRFDSPSVSKRSVLLLVIAALALAYSAAALQGDITTPSRSARLPPHSSSGPPVAPPT